MMTFKEIMQELETIRENNTDERQMEALNYAKEILKEMDEQPAVFVEKQKFVYRVIMKMSYYKFFYDFASIEEAADFSKTILLHHVPSEDNKSKEVYVHIEVLTVEEAERRQKELEDDDD